MMYLILILLLFYFNNVLSFKKFPNNIFSHRMDGLKILSQPRTVPSFRLYMSQQGIADFILSFFKSPKKETSNANSTSGSYSKKEPMRELSHKIVIIGAGISGLACAKELIANGESDLVLLEASSEAGGRVKTDNVQGYLLDRGTTVRNPPYSFIQFI